MNICKGALQISSMYNKLLSADPVPSLRADHAATARYRSPARQLTTVMT